MSDSLVDVRVTWAAPHPASPTHPLLDDAERQRCARFRLDADSRRHATARVVAKLEAGALLGVAAARVSVVPDRRPPTTGRPRIAVDGELVADLHVSITHAGEVALVALSQQACGVDVERIDGLSNLLDSDIVFGPGERARLAALPVDARLRLAAHWWTVKEAALKAVGRGLAEEPASLDASDADIAGHIVVTACGVVSRWITTALDAPAGYAASLASITTPRVEMRLLDPPSCEGRTENRSSRGGWGHPHPTWPTHRDTSTPSGLPRTPLPAATSETATNEATASPPRQRARGVGRLDGGR